MITYQHQYLTNIDQIMYENECPMLSRKFSFSTSPRLVQCFRL